ncbi:hypothetical protein TRM7557_01590 [Tritonibacter multivorans]|uniref:Pectate lyase C n=1 Tax=Tritonibacter multivorans TaxID=928856 RepID=A0A0P1G839_9RHOB|nr:hypothetical protein [Tritonibacter multivorans]MDA7422261.1 hypothetical protein [Tritonibacter multivorans]CUH77800.1 hypothetical protein TRM7557_01590 [Tritonibacter multivorans]SFD11517.1 Pectate lyase [Tritonibacter multivorans]
MSTTTNAADLAFAGAEGFGAETTGGRGGEIIHVTNLNDSGKGSLRWALEQQDGPRIVVFDVSGEINLKDMIKVNGDVTIAGQTSPNGVTVTGAKLRIVEDNVIVRGMQFRPGDGDGDTPDNRDGLSIGSSSHTVKNVIVDSNSFSWSIDELVTVWYGAQNVTISNNIMAEALQSSIHSKGDHSMGLLVGDGAENVTIVGNLIAHNEFRNMTVKDDSKQIEFINNVVYNYGPNGLLGHEGTTAHIIGNAYIAGKDSAGRAAIQLKSPEAGTAYYLEDNIAEVDGGATSKIKNKYVFEPSNVTVLPSSQVVDHVLSNAGARYPELNDVDERIIQSVKDGTGRIIDSPDQVGGYDFGKNVAAPKDSDKDGIPDAVEKTMGTNPNKFDAHGDADGDGISNIEDYINGLIDGDVATAPVETPTDTGSGGSDTGAGGVSDSGSSDDTGSSGSAGSGSSGTGSSGSAMRVEAEDFKIIEGFFESSNNAASGDDVLQVKGTKAGEAELAFDGASGTYDLVIGYFDENDGKAELSVLVNGKAVDSWKWNKDLGSDLANNKTLTERVIEGVEINEGDTVTLVGKGQGKEPLRVDYVDLRPQLVGEVMGEDTFESGVDIDPIKIEAESLLLEDGFRIESNGHASGGDVIRVKGGGEGTASTFFEGETGIYDIAIDYFDEADGASFLEVVVGGEVVDAWTWNAETEQNLASKDSLARHVIEDIQIAAGDAIVLQGYADGGEPLRIDSIELFADALLA